MPYRERDLKIFNAILCGLAVVALLVLPWPPVHCIASGCGAQWLGFLFLVVLAAPLLAFLFRLAGAIWQVWREHRRAQRERARQATLEQGDPFGLIRDFGYWDGSKWIGGGAKQSGQPIAEPAAPKVPIKTPTRPTD